MVVPLLRTHFYVTESEPYKQQVWVGVRGEGSRMWLDVCVGGESRGAETDCRAGIVTRDAMGVERTNALHCDAGDVVSRAHGS